MYADEESGELDPLGNDMGKGDPYAADGLADYAGDYTSGGNGFDESGGGCIVDHMPRPCSETYYLQIHGLAEQCPYNNCGPRVVSNNVIEKFAPLGRDPQTGGLAYWLTESTSHILYSDSVYDNEGNLISLGRGVRSRGRSKQFFLSPEAESAYGGDFIGIGFTQQRASKDAKTIERAVEAALHYLKYGCYDAGRPRDNPDINPENSDFATVSNHEKYTAGWSKVNNPPGVLGHGGELRLESPVIRFMILTPVPVHPLRAARMVLTPIDFVVKYYSAGGGDPARLAITTPQASIEHALSWPFYKIGAPVNLMAASTVLANLPRCYDPY